MPANIVHVTTNASSGSGSLVAAMAKVTDTYDPAFDPDAHIIIDSGIGPIGLSAPLFGNSVPLTHLEIDYAGVGQEEIGGAARFIDYTGVNGLVVDLNGLNLNGFYAPKITAGGLVLDSGDGGAIRISCTLNLNNCTVQNSIAGGNGGGIYSTYVLSATDTLFFANTAYGSGGAIYSQPSSSSPGVTLSGCTFTSNTATNGDGGAIYFYTATGVLTINDSTNNNVQFTANKALNGHGGGIYQYGGYISVISAATGPADGFTMNNDSSGMTASGANGMYLSELSFATLNVNMNDGSPEVYLHTFIPPSPPASPTINTARIGGAPPFTFSNWSPGWFY